MARLIFENLTIEQAKELGHFYEHFGEQVAYEWFRERDNSVEAPSVDVSHKPKWMQVEGDTVTVFCK